MHKAELGQEQNKRTYKDGKDNMTVTHIHCPVGLLGVLVMLGEEGMRLLRGYSTCLPYSNDNDNSENVESWVDERVDITAEQLAALNKSVQLVRLMLVKVYITFYPPYC